MKKILTMLLTVAMLFTLCCTAASAVNTPTFEISSVNADPGDTVDVTVSFKNNPGIASAKLKVSYGESLTLTNVTFNTSAIAGNATPPQKVDNKYKNPVTLSWIRATEGDLTADVVFATLTFKVAENAKAGSKADISLTYNADDVYNTAETNVSFDVKAGGVTVNSKECAHASKTLVPAKDSTCKEQGWDKYYKCDDCEQLFAADGATPIDEVPFRALGNHTGGTATCQAKAVCTVCGKSYGSLGSHNYTAKTQSAQTMKFAGDCKDLPEYYYSCSVCGTCEYNDAHTFTAGSLKPHSFTATDTDAKYLKSAANCVSMAEYYKSCAVCGAKGTDTFSYGSIDPSNHKGYAAVVTKPTCTEGGYTTHTCSCGDSYKDSETNALGHSYDSNGKCTRCDATVPVLKLKSQVTSVEVGKEMAIRADIFNVEGVHVEWACSSLNASISVSEDTLTCTVSGNSAGTATVYARLVYDADGTDVVSDDGTTSASYGVTVKEAQQENQSFFSKLISWFRDLFSKIFFFC